MTWKSGDETTLRGYKYTYDGLDRLKAGVYGEGSSLSTNSGRFTESVGSYDKNGNIKAGFVRSGLTSTGSYANLNALTIILNGNQIQAVTDHVPTVAATGGFEFVDGTSETVEYTYDNNGNLTKDSNKGITSIAYNSLNLPSKVTFSDGSTIVYTYAADGTKLRTVHAISGTSTQKDYCANVVYENGVQKLLLTEEGYVDLSVSTPAYYYYLKDHQGNNRVVVSSGGTVAEVNHYYPFGGVFASSGNVQPYKYNGKELDTKKGLNWYDYGARHYDATIGRWFVMDPLAEKYYAWSPYAYCFNNPMRFIDPNGKDGWDIIVGYGIGLLTNILPNTGFIRDSYIPTDVSDYNNALQGMDNASMVIGAGMIAGGGGAIITGETMTATGLALTVGSVGSASAVSIPTAVSGVVVTKTGAITVAAGVNMMNNAQQNKKAGYSRGKETSKGINQLNKEVQKGQAPKGITRFDKTHTEGGQEHVHFKDGSALNKDGSWKEGLFDMTKKQKEYLIKNGWNIEK